MPIKMFTAILSLLFISTLTTCQNSLLPTSTATVPPTTEPLTPTPTVATCAHLDANWGHNWSGVIDTLEQLIAADQSCGDESLLSKKYAAHFSYGAALEEAGKLKPAITQYRAALTIDPQRQEALDALFRLKALPEPTPAACLFDTPRRTTPAPAATPDPAQFVRVQGDQLQLNGQPFKIKGLNYYPRRAAWQRFLLETDPVEMAQELDLIEQAGFNTLRIFLWYEPLFTCEPEEAVPNEAAFATVDRLLKLADERDLKLIVTLNDLPDLTFRPLYTDYPHYDNQTRYIVQRYRNEPAILAWDLRNEGDLDHGAESQADARFQEEEVIDWLAHASRLVRDIDPHHLLTAGWWGDPTPTDPFVDFLSFHHWTDANRLQVRINEYRQSTARPLLLEEIGYSTQAASPAEEQDKENEVGNMLSRAVRIVEAQNIAGWVIWTAFDFVAPPGQPEHKEHFFGMWRTDLSPKPALETLPLP